MEERVGQKYEKNSLCPQLSLAAKIKHTFMKINGNKYFMPCSCTSNVWLTAK